MVGVNCQKKGFHSSKKNFKNKLKRLLNSPNMRNSSLVEPSSDFAILKGQISIEKNLNYFSRTSFKKFKRLKSLKKKWLEN
ncbi:hypothetical protein Taitung276_04870 [Helicobacter pylori]